MKMNPVFILFCVWASCWSVKPLVAAVPIKSDSIRAEQWLNVAQRLPKDSCRTLFFAQQLLGVPYRGHTLDTGKEEILVSRLDALDCTTFVETVVALTLTSREGSCSWLRFRKNLETLRYRNGRRQGYLSRLHYFSDWIADNERRGKVYERTATLQQAISTVLHLNFMSTHPQSYPQLKQHPEWIQFFVQMEQAWKGKTMYYLPKSKLHVPASELDIRNGEILALTTSIRGLDVVHVGFAIWVKGRLHLLHASSAHQKVVIDPQPLYEYTRKSKTHTGLRVIALPMESR